MTICHKCKYKLQPGWNFCPKCGVPIPQSNLGPAPALSIRKDPDPINKSDWEIILALPWEESVKDIIVRLHSGSNEPILYLGLWMDEINNFFADNDLPYRLMMTNKDHLSFSSDSLFKIFRTAGKEDK